MGYRVINGKIQFIGEFNTNASIKRRNIPKEQSNIDFKSILQNKTKKDKNESFLISNHALQRLRERNICFNQFDMKNINEGINKADKKGCKEAVILYKDTALVTSIKNRTVITVMSKNEGQGNVFTNIDGLVML